jgi:hypothetical protein
MLCLEPNYHAMKKPSQNYVATIWEAHVESKQGLSHVANIKHQTEERMSFPAKAPDSLG